MKPFGVAMDLGTSGFRAQAIDLERKGAIISTAVTTRHPLAGANVIDHIHFALEVGLEAAQETIIAAVNRVLGELGIDKDRVARLAICGNPIQLSLFQGIEIRDLAYAGQRKLDSLGVVPPKRNAQIVKARDIVGLDLPAQVDVLIPPAVRHEIGADALAMMIKTEMLKREEIALVTDYGTNAEMALMVKGTIYTGSTAAGPALEGQHIEDGLLALPGAISDVVFEAEQAETPIFQRNAKDSHPVRGTLKTLVLNEEMHACPGGTVDPTSGRVTEPGDIEAVGITGTGVVALISQGLKARLIQLPRVNTLDAEIHLPNGLRFTENDLLEAGKAIGSVRAGHITLCQEAGIRLEDIQTAYMSGASGTYVDAIKALEVGMIPAGVQKIYQVGNTSLAMARDLAMDEDALWGMQRFADDLRQNHCMFAASKIFEKVYILELSYWTEGMTWDHYQTFLKKYGFPELVPNQGQPEVIKTVERDIPDLGEKGLKIIPDIGLVKALVFEGCVGCGICVDECPEKALTMNALENDDHQLTIDISRCDGVACRRCERACPEKVFDLVGFLKSKNLVN